MTMDVLEIEHLAKSFGAHRVLSDLSFSVPEHSIYGFLGQNGAGKTTTMKMILGLLRQDSGTIRVLGRPVVCGQTPTNRDVGYLPDVPEFYGYMNPTEYLRLCGDITGLSAKKTRERSEELLSLVGLEKVRKRIGGFSRGMKQRLGIAQALLSEPRLLICDEPTSALDPIGRKEILDILARVKGKTTVLFSTHILSDVERICDRIAVLHNGSLALCGTLADLRGQRRRDALMVEFSSRSEKDRLLALPALKSFLDGAELAENSVVLHTQNIGQTQAVLLRALCDENLLPLKVEVLEPTLESLFLEVVR